MIKSFEFTVWCNFAERLMDSVIQEDIESAFSSDHNDKLAKQVNEAFYDQLTPKVLFLEMLLRDIFLFCGFFKIAFIATTALQMEWFYNTLSCIDRCSSNN